MKDKDTELKSIDSLIDLLKANILKIDQRSRRGGVVLPLSVIEEVVKKKVSNNLKKKYISFAKVSAVFFIAFMLIALIASLYIPNFVGAIIAMLDAINPFKGLDGGRAIDPYDYVNNFIK